MSTTLVPARVAVAPSADLTPTAPDGVAPSTTSPWRRRLTSDRAVGSAVAVGALTLGLWNVVEATAFADDEGIYTAQALAAADGALGPYTYWYDHPPFGWFQIAALAAIPRALGVGDGSGIAATRVVAGVLFALTATLVYLLARRVRAPQVVAVLAAAAFATSPLALTVGRQVFLDNVAVPWVLLALWLALSPRRQMWAHVGAGAAMGAALLTKLTFAVAGPAVLLALLLGQRTGPFWRGRRFSVTGFAAAGALVFSFFPLLALLRGELLAGPDRVSLEGGLRFQFESRATSGSFWDPTSPATPSSRAGSSRVVRWWWPGWWAPSSARSSAAPGGCRSRCWGGRRPRSSARATCRPCT
ncbi:glycosyltransferase family 39 protein [Litorihabitans aurantiacus]|uniref:Glycosyltransferase RgtA/B/C/D-like domain-containing protein n=1 Tax=Litorihabitans aurantiacus TaxID=1930061 RepID=A0AA37XCN8_9MICO|nr:glycosyltransferase family 39 protein [Litorihabitans aurantiacus]GMA30421.1 hypothetical protein GCM10025875_04130 [Litorihabitans aurantiacus]